MKNRFGAPLHRKPASRFTVVNKAICSISIKLRQFIILAARNTRLESIYEIHVAPIVDAYE
jgi:hypothetical protein